MGALDPPCTKGSDENGCSEQPTREYQVITAEAGPKNQSRRDHAREPRAPEHASFPPPVSDPTFCKYELSS